MNITSIEYGLILTTVTQDTQDGLFAVYDDEDEFWIINSSKHSVSYLDFTIETSAWINDGDQMDKWVVSFGSMEDSGFVIPDPPIDIEAVIVELNLKIPGCNPVWGCFKIER
jgi:hypothetical protein